MSAACESTSQVQSDGLYRVFVIIPMLNEQDSIEMVLDRLPHTREVVVVDNGSTDESPNIARRHGATIVTEPTRGYGKACLTGIEFVSNRLQTQDGSSETYLDLDDAIIVFIDGDFSDHPEELIDLVRPIVSNESDFVIGSRSLGKRERGAMPFQAIFGNWLACFLMRLFWGAKFTDLGPFRAIRYRSLMQLNMKDENFGWTIEMQIKAHQKKLRIKELPVSYRRRVGVSKISGTLSGTIRAGYKILYTIFRYRFFGSN